MTTVPMTSGQASWYGVGFSARVITLVMTVVMVWLTMTTAPVSAQDPLPVPEPTPAEASERATEILSRPEYQPPPESIPQKITNWVSEKIGAVIEKLVSGDNSSVIGWIVILIVLGLVGLMVWRVVRATSPTAKAEASSGVAFEVVERRTSAQWRSEAERLEAEGNWKDALLCRYRALVGDLVERGVLGAIPGRTTGEYRTDLAGSAPTVAGDFSGASDLFDDAWYGDLPTGSEENERFRNLAERVVAEVGR